jgi:tetratricopeptide (TPR) repeat protein
LRSANRFLVAVLFIAIFCFGTLAQKPAAKYTDFDRGYYYYYYGKKDSAFLMFTGYINNADDSLKKGKAYWYMGQMLQNIGDLYSAQDNLVAAIRSVDPDNKDHQQDLGDFYNTLGNVSLDLKLYDEAIELYDKALGFSKTPDGRAEKMNGKATAFQKKGQYQHAIAIYDSVLALQPADQLLVARVIDNRARTMLLQDPAYPVLPALRAALKIRIDSQYSPGLNASYAHLSDYYARSNPDSALWYAQKMRSQATANQSNDDILEAMDKIIRLIKPAFLKEQWYEEYKELRDSLQFSRDTTRNRFAIIRYGVEKNKADNLELKVEIEKRKVDNLVLQQNNTRQRLILFGFIAIAIAIVAGLLTWFTKRRKRIKQDAENEIRNSKLKTSQKVHDVVANGLYRVMNGLEHTDSINKELLLDSIEDLYEKSRDISYEDISPVNRSDHDKQVHDLLMAFDNELTKVFIVGNEQKYWTRITSTQKQQLHLILDELMINMKKHSQAKNVVIVFKEEGKKSCINYKDDGVGFPAGFEFGNGLNNTVSRIKSMNGEINFGKSEKEGVSITISFPPESNTI